MTANDSTGHAYIGSKVTLQCQVMIHPTARNELVLPELLWYRDQLEGIRVHSCNYMNCNLTLLQVGQSDNDSYTCTATVHPVDQRLQTYVVNGAQSSEVVLHVKS